MKILSNKKYANLLQQIENFKIEVNILEKDKKKLEEDSKLDKDTIKKLTEKSTTYENLNKNIDNKLLESKNENNKLQDKQFNLEETIIKIRKENNSIQESAEIQKKLLKQSNGKIGGLICQLNKVKALCKRVLMAYLEDFNPDSDTKTFFKIQLKELKEWDAQRKSKGN